MARARPQTDRVLTLVDHGLGSGANQSEVADAIQRESPSTGWGRDQGSHSDAQQDAKPESSHVPIVGQRGAP